MSRKEPFMANVINNKYGAMLAKKHSLSRLCVNREKLETADLIGEVLTIEDCDIASDVLIDGELTTFSIYTFKEYPGKFLYGGTKLTAIAPDIIEISKNEKKAIADLGIQIMLKGIRVKSGNNFTDVIFI